MSETRRSAKRSLVIAAVAAAVLLLYLFLGVPLLGSFPSTDSAEQDWLWAFRATGGLLGMISAVGLVAGVALRAPAVAQLQWVVMLMAGLLMIEPYWVIALALVALAAILAAVSTLPARAVRRAAAPEHVSRPPDEPAP